MNRLNLQGRVFCVAAVLLCAITAWLPGMQARTELLVALLLMSLFGVPHGALDSLFAQRLHGLASPLAWVGFVVAYLGLAASVVALWWVIPGVFLVGFLVVSAAHFSGDLRRGANAWARLFYGAAVVVLPTALHASEVTQLFAWLTDLPSATVWVGWMHQASWVVLLGLLASAAWLARTDSRSAIEIIAVGAVSTWATPLLGFTLYFCLMHSARHTLRSQHYAQATVVTLVKTAVWPLLGLAALVAPAWVALQNLAPETTPDQRAVQLFFVALAALTVPHMVLVERVRWSGWSLDTAEK
jgi:beta-carotene 15,15'-dioxygenase